MFLKFHKNLDFDPNKENIIFTANNQNAEYIHGYLQIILKELEKKYNIIRLGSNSKFLEKFNYILFDTPAKTKIQEKMIRKNDIYDTSYKSHKHYNHLVLIEAIEKSLPNIDIKYLISGDDWNMLPLIKYKNMYQNELYNEFFDYIGTNKNTLEKVNADIEYLKNNYFEFMNPIAFTEVNLSAIINLFIQMGKKYTPEHISAFMLDPTQCHLLYENSNRPVNILYFINDIRGTRNFKEFPIAQFQHCIYDYDFQVNKNKPVSERKSFMFGANMFSSSLKTQRVKLFYNLLENFYLPDADIFIPMSKSIITTDITEKQKEIAYNKILSNEKKIIIQLSKDIQSHKNYKGYIKPIDLYKEIGNYRYAYIPSCISYNDSLNFRPVLFVQNNVLPILERSYDPEYLLIPKYIQEEIVADTHEELLRTINYFDMHLEKRKEIIEELKIILKIQEARKDPGLFIKENIFRYWSIA